MAQKVGAAGQLFEGLGPLISPQNVVAPIPDGDRVLNVPGVNPALLALFGGAQRGPSGAGNLGRLITGG